MDQLLSLLAARWLGAALLGVALVLGAAFWLAWRKFHQQPLPLLVAGIALALAGLGGLFVPPHIGMWLVIGAAAFLFAKLLYLILTSQWWSPLAIAAGGVLALGVGGWCGIPLGEALVLAGKAV